MLIALGIDPGSKVTGYGLVVEDGPRLRLINAGQIRTSQKAPLPKRLNQIYSRLQEIISELCPDIYWEFEKYE